MILNINWSTNISYTESNFLCHLLELESSVSFSDCLLFITCLSFFELEWRLELMKSYCSPRRNCNYSNQNTCVENLVVGFKFSWTNMTVQFNSGHLIQSSRLFCSGQGCGQWNWGCFFCCRSVTWTERRVWIWPPPPSGGVNSRCSGPTGDSSCL